MSKLEPYEGEGDIADRASVSLRVFAPDLDPLVVTNALAVAPTFAARRGDRRHSNSANWLQPVGIWTLAPASPQRTLEQSIDTLLDQLPSDLAIWSRVATLGSIDVFGGFFVTDGTSGFDLSPALLARMAERHIRLSVDVYCVPDSTEADV